MAPSPIIYMIRHGEKPPKDGKGNDVVGLSAKGLDRAQGLVKVFGRTSQYDIGYILAQHPKKDGTRARPRETVAPLATELDIPIDDSIGRDDEDGAADAARAYPGPGNVLICWEHDQLSKIAAAIGVKRYAAASGESGKVKYPDDRFDIIWTIPEPYKEIVSVTSENIPRLDDGSGDPWSS